MVIYPVDRAIQRLNNWGQMDNNIRSSPAYMIIQMRISFSQSDQLPAVLIGQLEESAQLYR